MSDEELVDELSRVIYDSDMATTVLSRVGFPRSRLPVFTTPFVFWSKVVEALAQVGIAEGKDGVQKLIDVVAGLYRGNVLFNDYRSSSPW